jgi:uncharacterized protein (DUF58 family)
MKPFVTWRLALAFAVLALVIAVLPGPVAWPVFIGGDLLLLALAAADASRAPGREGFAVERECPSKLSLGADNDVSVSVANLTGRRVRLVVRDIPPPEFQLSGVGAGAGAGATAAQSAPADATRPRQQPSTTALDLGPHVESVHSYHVRPVDRGVFLFSDIWLRSLGPLGLAGRQFAVDAAREVHVYPNIQAVGEYELLARKGALFEMGVRAAPLGGGRTEFESLREYQPGDGFRQIDWKATARRRRPITQVFETERSQTLMLAIDAGRLMAPRIDGVSKLDHSINAALMMAYVASQTDDLVGLVVFGREVQAYLPPRKGRAQFLAILDRLFRVQGELSAEPDYAKALRYAAMRTGKRSLFVVFSDLAGVEPSRRLLTVLFGLLPRHLPLLVTVRDEVIEASLARTPKRAEDAYEQAVAAQLLLDRADARRELVQRGALVLDALPRELSVSAVNTYLEVKARGRL